VKRDMDLIRQILLDVEDTGPNEMIPSVDGYDSAAFAYSVSLMEQAGLVEATVAMASGHIPVKASVYSLTWDGHDFLDAIRNDTLWASIKSRLTETVGSVSFDVLKSVAGAMALRLIAP